MNSPIANANLATHLRIIAIALFFATIITITSIMIH
jgi:hypothetical protein